MPRTRIDDRGQVVEIPPAVLACGCRFTPGQVTIGYNPAPAGGRARTYYCRICRVTTYSEPDNGRGQAAGER